jgi:hypothetical protein
MTLPKIATRDEWLAARKELPHLTMGGPPGSSSGGLRCGGRTTTM